MAMALLLELLLLLVVAGLLIWGWGVFLDMFEHDPARVRAVMCLGVLAAMAFEWCLHLHGVVQPWVVWVSVAANVWGAMDAVLRFPAAHKLESFFSAKQFALLVGKTFAFAAGMADFKQDVWLFLILLLTNIWVWPVFYTMGLPMDPAEQVIKDDAYDVDLVLRVWQLASSGSERRACLTSCRGWWYRRLAAVSEESSFARMAICAASPEHRRIFKQMGRSV